MSSHTFSESRSARGKARCAGNGGSIAKQCNAALGASGLARRESLQCDSASLQPLNMEPPCPAGCASQNRIGGFLKICELMIHDTRFPCSTTAHNENPSTYLPSFTTTIKPRPRYRSPQIQTALFNLPAILAVSAFQKMNDFDNRYTVLITGALGQVGKRCVGLLLRRGCKVVALDIKNEANLNLQDSWGVGRISGTVYLTRYWTTDGIPV
jgi:hypothetical protein